MPVPAPVAPHDRANTRPTDETLGVVLHRHASARVPLTLTLQVLDGALVSSVALFAHAKPWTLLAIAGLCVAMHGVWSIAELRVTHDVSRSTASRLTWRALRAVAAVVGIGSVFGFILTLFGFTLGTWIS